MRQRRQSLNGDSLFEACEEKDSWCEEHYLWAEVLIDGFRCAVEEKLWQKYPDFLKPRQPIYRDYFARNWLFSNRLKMGSFLWILETLKITHRAAFIRDLYDRADYSFELMGTRIFRKWYYPKQK